ncbi:MAG: hypothetical protein ACJ8C4_02685 [Gemmataceae bacterium]
MSFLRFLRGLTALRNRKRTSGILCRPNLQRLERRDVPNGYLAVGAGAGSFPWVAIRVDIQDQLGGSALNTLGNPAPPRSDGKTDFTAQMFMPFASTFRGGVHTAAGNFDGLAATPDSLVTAAGPGGGPHVIIWNMKQMADGRIMTDGIRDQFFAFDARFRGGVNVTTGDLDGDGKAELIVAAGAGGGPHVKIYRDVNGRFQLASEFFAFDAGFRGGVSVGSGQGYDTLVQQRFLVDHLPDREPVYPAGDKPGTRDGIPFTGVDIATGRPYVTVGGGPTQYLSANLLDSWTQVGYRPDIFTPPGVANPNGVGTIVYAQWPLGSTHIPTGFQAGVTYGPFVRIGANQITRITSPRDTAGSAITDGTEVSDALTSVNDLVVGAGPGGGPHVKIYDFVNNGDGTLTPRMGKEFFAFDASFHGGVNVAMGDVIAHTNPFGQVIPGRFDYVGGNFIRDTDQDSGTQAFLSYPYDTALFEKLKPEVIVAMASQGNTVRIFGDAAPYTSDVFNPFSNQAPARRTDLSQLNLIPYTIDTALQVDPNANALTSFMSVQPTTDFHRTVDNSLFFSGGVNPSVAYFRFGSNVGNPLLGTDQLMQTSFYGFDQATGANGSAIATNPVLGEVVFGSGGSPSGQAPEGSRIRIFNQLGEFRPDEPQYQSYDDFQGITDASVQGAFTAFGFGVLPTPTFPDVVYANYAATAGGNPNGNALNVYAVPTLGDPFLV